MLRSGFRPSSLFVAGVLLVSTTAFTACSHERHPDNRMAVYNALDQSDLRSVTVSQDRDAGVITLSGIVGSDERKKVAEQIAHQAAPKYSIVDRIQVENSGLQGEIKAETASAQLDSAIEDQYKAKLASTHLLKDQDIQCSATNGTLTLKGTVKSVRERKEAEDIAKKLPQVQHVVNEIEIKGARPKPASS